MTAAAFADLATLLAAAFRLAAWSVVLSLPLVILCAWCIESRRGSAAARVLEAAVNLPLLMSPLLALALIGGITGAPAPLSGLLGLAAAASGFPLVVRPLRRALAAQDPRLARIARSLGASDLRVALTVTVPPLLPTLLGGATAATLRATLELALVTAPGRPAASVAGALALTLTLAAALCLLALLPGKAPDLRRLPA